MVLTSLLDLLSTTLETFVTELSDNNYCSTKQEAKHQASLLQNITSHHRLSKGRSPLHADPDPRLFLVNIIEIATENHFEPASIKE